MNNKENSRTFRGSRGVQNLTGRVGSGVEVFESHGSGQAGSRVFQISRVGSGWVNNFRISRVGSDRIKR